jgi:AraC family transcriptional regulator
MNEYILLNIAKIILDNTWNYSDITSPFYRLYYISDGSGKIEIDGQEKILKKGNMYLVPSYTLANYRCEHSMEQTYMHIAEKLRMPVSLKQQSELFFEVKAEAIDQMLIERLLVLNMDKKLITTNPRNEAYVPQIDVSVNSRNMETQGILLQLMARFVDKPKSSFNISSNKNQKIAIALENIHLNYHKNLSVAQLAAEVHINEDYFSRLFKKVTGFLPNAYLTKVRLEKAQQLLLFSDESVTEIAFKSGFNNRTYFAKVFKEATNKSPKEYRMREEIG